MNGGIFGMKPLGYFMLVLIALVALAGELSVAILLTIAFGLWSLVTG